MKLREPFEPKRIVSKVRHSAQHHLNDAHVYCRLRDLGFGRAWAKRLALAVEVVLNPFSIGGDLRSQVMERSF
jgi:hypothetical protein